MRKIKWQKIVLPLILLVVSISVYFYRFGEPYGPYWDENYHIASAEKYIEGTFFMEVHPPLGKLFIALGEALTKSNQTIDKSSFTSTDYISNFPAGYSFKGVRLFPTIFAILNVLTFFLLLLLITKNKIIAFCFSLLLLFDNAIMIHFRGAMVDSIQMFFVLVSLAWAFYLIKFQKKLR
jgi:dolichyl-phosphate-mannose--protein O-mannosyl transferase